MFGRQCCHCWSVVCLSVVLFVTKRQMQALVTDRFAAILRNTPDWSGLLIKDCLLLVVHCCDLG